MSSRALALTRLGLGPHAQEPSTMTVKRVQREINDLKKEDLGGMRLQPSDTSILVWTGALPGPEGSVYEGGTFEFDLTLPIDYPFTAPKIIFKTRIYHMNIAQTGHICLDILKNMWSPALSLFKVMLSLSSLFTDPNPSDPLVPTIASEFRMNRQRHDETARNWTQMYAMKRATTNPTPSVPTPSSNAAPPSRLARSATAAARRNEVTILNSSPPAVTAQSTSSRNGNGPAARPPRPPRAARNQPSSSTTNGDGVIIISDEEDTEARSRPHTRAGVKRKRGQVTPTNVDDEDDDEISVAGPSSSGGAVGGSNMPRGGGSAGSSRPRRRPPPPGGSRTGANEEVILIDD